MRRSLALLVMIAAAFAVGCERDTAAPTSPEPTPPTEPPPFLRALIVPVGVYTFTGCTFGSNILCQFNASLENRGSGCAIRVEGTTRLFDVATQLQIGSVYKWALPAQQVVRPAERIPYVVNFVPLTAAQQAGSYLTDVNWIDTSCR